MHLLFSTLSAFDRKEMTRFRDFALSPYFNKHEGLREIVCYCHKIYPQFTEKNCSNSAITQSVFSNRKETETQLPVLLTYLRRLVFQFLDVEAYRGSHLVDSVFLLEQLRQKNQSAAHQKQLERERIVINEQKFRDGNFFYKKYLLEREADQLYIQKGINQEAEAFQQKANHLDAFYLSEKLKDACEMLVRSRLMKVDYSSVLMEAILQVIQKDQNKYFDIPPIHVYYHIYQMIVQEEVSYYEDAFASVEKHASFFPKAELQNIYNYLQNYCVFQINKGRADFLPASFRLYQIQLEKALLFIDGFLPEWHYKNMVATGLRLQELDWVHQFLEDYRPLLLPEVQENAYAYNLAEYHYATGAYKKAMQLLLQVSYTNPRYSMGAKALLLKTYYDLEEHEALVALCKSFSQLLLRDKSTSEFRRQGYKHLFEFTRKASHLRDKQPYTKPEQMHSAWVQLKKEVKEAEPIFNRAWLEERIGEFGC
jgi:hypothetical protein